MKYTLIIPFCLALMGGSTSQFCNQPTYEQQNSYQLPNCLPNSCQIPYLSNSLLENSNEQASTRTDTNSYGNSIFPGPVGGCCGISGPIEEYGGIQTRPIYQPICNKPISSPPIYNSQPIYNSRSSYNSQPIYTQPLCSQPIYSQPISSQPICCRPICSEPTSNQPISTQPISSQPISSHPYCCQPICNYPIPSQPLSSQPISSQPFCCQPICNQQCGGNIVPTYRLSPKSVEALMQLLSQGSPIAFPHCYQPPSPVPQPCPPVPFPPSNQTSNSPPKPKPSPPPPTPTRTPSTKPPTSPPSRPPAADPCNLTPAQFPWDQSSIFDKDNAFGYFACCNDRYNRDHQAPHRYETKRSVADNPMTNNVRFVNHQEIRRHEKH